MNCYHGSDMVVDAPRIFCDQILFHTNESLKYLKFIKAEVIGDE